jgi:hypothetical protein
MRLLVLVETSGFAYYFGMKPIAVADASTKTLVRQSHHHDEGAPGMAEYPKAVTGIAWRRNYHVTLEWNDMEERLRRSVETPTR